MDVLWSSMIFGDDSNAPSSFPEFRRSLSSVIDDLRRSQSYAAFPERITEKMEDLKYLESMSGIYFDALYMSITLLWIYRRKTFSFSLWRFCCWNAVGAVMKKVVPKLAWLFIWSLLILVSKLNQTLTENAGLRAMGCLSEFVADAKSMECTGRHFCISEEGYVAWIPPQAQPGDEICVFEGSHIPFVIRRVDEGLDGRNSYRLIGDCYVHGRMKQAREGFSEIASFEGCLV